MSGVFTAYDKGLRPRIALIAGTLGEGGAEKQLVCVARALLQAGFEVRVYALGKGEFHQGTLEVLGVPVLWFGQFSNRALRLSTLAFMLSRFRPHLVQSCHAFTNLYAALVARLFGAISLGAERGDFTDCRLNSGIWARYLMTVPTAVVVNSRKAASELNDRKIRSPDGVYLLPNAIDLVEFDESARSAGYVAWGREPSVKAIFVGRLIPDKRIDRFLAALAIACRQVPALKGIVVGDGPERHAAQQLAEEVGLAPTTVCFLGKRSDVAALLAQADMMVLSSDHEGLPNVILEAMAARLPVITTPAGDAGKIVRNDVTGYVVSFGDTEAMGRRIVHLARSAELRRSLGAAGRRHVEEYYSFATMTAQLLSIYGDIARRNNHRMLLRLLHADRVSPMTSSFRGSDNG